MRRRPVGRALLLGVAIALVVAVVSRVGVLSGWETRAVDAFLFLRDRVPSPDIVLVVVDDDAFRELAERQPLPRNYLAELADVLLRSGARVVAFDIHLTSPSIGEEDAALVEVARRWESAPGGRLVFATAAVAKQRSGAMRYEAPAALIPGLPGVFGYSNAPIGVDGVIRRMAWLLPASDGGQLPSFGLAVLAAYAGYTPAELTRVLRTGADGSLALPVLNAQGQVAEREPITLGTLGAAPWRIDFIGPPGSFTTFPSGPLVQLGRTGVQPDPANPFRGKIVLVGASFRESRDSYPTPTGPMSGVEIQANAVHTLLARRARMPPPWGLNLAFLIAGCVAVSLLSLWLEPLWVTLAILGVIGGFAAVSYEAYTRGGYWLDFVAPVVAMLLYLEGSRMRARRRLRAAFGQYVSPEIVERVLREGAALGGEVRTVTVLMSDLRGFTTLAERLAPARVTGVLDDYLAAMVETIMSHRGLVQDFIGDGILAVYGAPLDDADHAWHAVVTALGMQAALERLNQSWTAQGVPPLAMGVAVHTGEAFAGTVGSARRKKYAVVGDTVNTVARIEGLNRELATRILLSGATFAAVKDRVLVRDRGSVMVKGKTQPIELFELLRLPGGGDAGAEDAGGDAETRSASAPPT